MISVCIGLGISVFTFNFQY